MQEVKRRRRTAHVAQQSCVSCGCCVKVCPFGAITIYRGIFAQVDSSKCVGCGKCVKECPASVIEVKEAAG